jgi:hypothetical protein
VTLNVDIDFASVISKSMKSVVRKIAAMALAGVVAACTPTQELMAKTRPAGTFFDGMGNVTLHRGQPCASQIVFDFHPAESKSPVWLAADVRASKQLTQAAREHRRVHIVGTWKRGREKQCGYVDVKKVIVQTSKWRLFGFP